MKTNNFMPKISLICPTYNHERWISSFINSILSQTYKNFELIIIDDSSTDRTKEKIKQFSDRRIKLIEHTFNQGINAGLNDGLEIANGEIIVFGASDDVFFPNHFETVIKTFQEHKNVIVFYPLLARIDEHDAVLPGNFGNYNQDTRYNILKQLFFVGNALPSPGMAVRSNVLKRIYPLLLSLCITQDYQMHIRLLLMGDYLLSKEPLVYYRFRNDNTNISSLTDTTQNRLLLENDLLMDAFLHMTAKQATAIFNEELRELQLTAYDNVMPFILGRLALLSAVEYKRVWGFRKIYSFLGKKSNFELVHTLYGFDFKDLLSLSVVDEIDESAMLFGGIEKFFYKRYRHFLKKRIKKNTSISALKVADFFKIDLSKS